MIVTLPQSPKEWHQKVWSLSWPMILANLTIPLVGVVDTAIMGRLPDPRYVGAIAVGVTIMNALYWMFGFLCMATTGLAANRKRNGHWPCPVWALSDVFSDREMMSATVRIAAIRFVEQIDKTGQEQSGAAFRTYWTPNAG